MNEISQITKLLKEIDSYYAGHGDVCHETYEIALLLAKMYVDAKPVNNETNN